MILEIILLFTFSIFCTQCPTQSCCEASPRSPGRTRSCGRMFTPMTAPFPMTASLQMTLVKHLFFCIRRWRPYACRRRRRCAVELLADEELPKTAGICGRMCTPMMALPKAASLQVTIMALFCVWWRELPYACRRRRRCTAMLFENQELPKTAGTCRR